jgi:hypothetical protein
MDSVFPIEGGCDCRAVRYHMLTAPLVVHCCHCHWCQRETGTAFALNAMIESDRVINLDEEPELVLAPSESGRGQRIARCPHCRIAAWSHYSSSGPLTKFVRVGTLDDPTVLPPDVHILTACKQPWVTLPSDVPSYADFYDRKDIWRQESLDRFGALQPEIEKYRASLPPPPA